jgi:RNA polymerase sigma-70 factor (ECF subfamily)
MKPRLLVSSRTRTESPLPPEAEVGIEPSSEPADVSTEVSAALDATVSRFAALTRRIGRSYRLPDDTIDEAVQEVRIRLWRTLATAPDIRRVPATYIYRTTVSAMLDLIRRRRSQREAAVESLESRVTPLPAPTPSPDARLDTSDVTHAVAEAIDTIPESRRAVVRMYLSGYAREEIAALLAWSEPKTRNLLYRGLEDLRQALTARGIGVEGRL